MSRYSRSWALMSELIYSFQYSTLCRVIIKAHHVQVLKCCNGWLDIPDRELWCQSFFIHFDTWDWSKPQKLTRTQFFKCCNRCLDIPTDKLWLPNFFILFDTRDWSKPEKLNRTQVFKCCNRCLDIPTDKLWLPNLFVLFDTRDWSKPEKLITSKFSNAVMDA
jgi:hypothetical protein